jgi:hypothetical protein
MPSLYIVLAREVPNAHTYVNGKLLSKHRETLESLAKLRGCPDLSAFLSARPEEFAAIGASPDVRARASEPWFAAEDDLRTIEALFENLADASVNDRDCLESELREFAALLELAKSNGIRWHLAADY